MNDVFISPTAPVNTDANAVQTDRVLLEGRTRGERSSGWSCAPFTISSEDSRRCISSVPASRWLARRVFTTIIRTTYAFVAFPGGIGTVDELFEALTLVQTGKIEHFPVVLIGSAYWQPLLSFLHGMAA